MDSLTPVLNQQPVISFDNVSFVYPAKHTTQEAHIALRNVSFSINAGEYVCLLGTNGSGKSTVAQLINGLLLPTQGCVTTWGYDTTDPAHIHDVRQHATMVFQKPEDQLVADICSDDVAFGPENICLDHNTIVTRVQHSLEQVGLEHYAQDNPLRLSGGQQQRVALAGSLAMLPQILILDEPTAMLDSQSKKNVTRLISKLHSQGFTIIHITHSMEDVLDATRVLIFNKSKLIHDITPDALFSQPEMVYRLGLELPAQLQLDMLVSNHAPTVKISRPQAPSAQHNPILEFDHVWYSYNPPAKSSKFKSFFTGGNTPSQAINWAIQDASFSIEEGSFTALIGKSGSGKSTTLSLSCGVLSPTRGTISLNGTPLKKLQQSERIFHTVGYVTQSAEQQLFASTIYEDIAFGPRNQGLSEDEVDRRVQDAVAQVGLSDIQLNDTSPFSLSGGQQKLVTIAGVLAMNPSILILDEPLAGLDPQTRQHILNVLVSLNKQGTTILIITHAIDEAATYASNILAFDEGEILAHCPTKEFFTHPTLVDKLGLGYPSAMQLAQKLRQQGQTIDGNPLTLEELALHIRVHNMSSQEVHV